MSYKDDFLFRRGDWLRGDDGKILVVTEDIRRYYSESNVWTRRVGSGQDIYVSRRTPLILEEDRDYIMDAVVLLQPKQLVLCPGSFGWWLGRFEKYLGQDRSMALIFNLKTGHYHNIPCRLDMIAFPTDDDIVQHSLSVMKS